MDPLAPVVAGLLALPLGWVACFLVERVPDYEHHVLRRPFGLTATPARRVVGLTGVLVVLFVALGLRFERPADLAVYLGFGFVMVVLATIDLDTLRLPDRLVLPYLAISVALVVAVSTALAEPERITAAFTGGAVYFGFLFVVHLAFGPRALGFGDVKLAAVMGLYVGWVVETPVRALALVLWAMFLGFVVGALIGIVLYVVKRGSRHYPFGPFLVLGSLAAILLSLGLLSQA